jgi:hypothetical protein
MAGARLALPDGKDAVYAGWELEPMERSATGGAVLSNLRSYFLSILLSSLLPARLFFGGGNVCCPKPERSRGRSA